MGLHCNQVDAECPFDVSGFTFAGFPGVVIGHNADIAWGFTNLYPDTQDLYLETGLRRQHVSLRRQADAAEDAARRRSKSPGATSPSPSRCGSRGTAR